MYECVHCVYGGRNILEFLTETYYYLTAIISCNIHIYDNAKLIRLYIKYMYISSIYFISMYAVVKM